MSAETRNKIRDKLSVQFPNSLYLALVNEEDCIHSWNNGEYEQALDLADAVLQINGESVIYKMVALLSQEGILIKKEVEARPMPWSLTEPWRKSVTKSGCDSPCRVVLHGPPIPKIWRGVRWGCWNDVCRQANSTYIGVRQFL